MPVKEKKHGLELGKRAVFPQRNTFPPKVVESYTMNAFKKELGTFCSPTNCGLFRGIWSVGTVSPLLRWLTDEGSTLGDPQHLDTESWIRCQATAAVCYSQSLGDQKQNSAYMHLQTGYRGHIAWSVASSEISGSHFEASFLRKRNC